LSYSKILRGFENYERNTDQRHPFSVGLKDFKRIVGKLPLTVHLRQMWSGSIFVGTPPVQYTVDIDTGSSDLILPAENCDSTCSGHTLYDPSASSTSTDLEIPFSVYYIDGSFAPGILYNDTVTLAPHLSVVNQTFGAATQYSKGFQAPKFP
jgi:cathepsin D